jgi:DNA polymerase II small subunit/DNA polymerase delta subunit B
MEKKELIDIFLKKGLMVDLDTLEYFSKNPEQVEIFLKEIEKKKVPAIIKMDFVKSIVKPKEIKIEEIKKKIFEKKIISIDDISKILIERYERIKSFFSYRMDIVNLISINKISEKTKKFSLIVMIKEIDKKNKAITVEDLTGETLVFSQDKFLDLMVQDEVVGLVCEKNDRIEVLNVLWPDIPLNRKIASLEENVCCAFISEKVLGKKRDVFLKKIFEIECEGFLIFLFFEHLDEKEVEEFKKNLPLNSKLILIKKGNLEPGENIFSPPVFLNVENKVKMLLCDGNIFSSYQGILGEKTEEIMLNLLKKRHLDPVFSVEKAVIEDRLIIDPVPDIFVSFDFGSSGLINYKGTTIISSGSSEQMFWIVNLKSRESLKIDLT